MGFEYKLERVFYRQLNNESMIKVTGWAFHTKSSELIFNVYYNNQKVPFDYKRVNRVDVLNANRKYLKASGVGFALSIPVSEPASLKVEIVYQDVKRVIVRKTEKEISKIFDEHILFDIESLRCRKDHIIASMNAFSVDGSSLTLSLNREGTITSRVRDDLYKFGITEEVESCGYTVNYPIIENNPGLLTLDDGHHQLVIDFEAELKKEQKKSNVVKKVIRKIKPQNVRKVVRFVKRNGILELPAFIKRKMNLYGRNYDEWFNENCVSEEELENQKNTHFEKEPKISILVPTYKTPIPYLQEMIDSVRNQSYGNFELCIADGSEGDELVEAELERYAQLDSRIKYQLLEKNLGISGNTNACVEMATGDYISLFDHDDVLAPDALFEIVKALNEDDYDVLYTDEDKIIGDTGEHDEPHFKPDYSPDLLLTCNYITHFFTVKTSIMREIKGFNSLYDGAQDYDIILRSIEHAKKVKHIPKVVYHWRIHPNSTAADPGSKTYAYESGIRACKHHLDRQGIHASVEHFGGGYWGHYHVNYILDEKPLVSIIINSLHPSALKTTITSLNKKNMYKNIEIIVVSNTSNQDITSVYPNVKVVETTIKDNIAAMNNLGAKETKGDYLLFINNGIQLINENSIEQMLGSLLRDNVGAVGGKLLLKDDSVYHAGILLEFDSYGTYVFQGIDHEDIGTLLYPNIVRNYSAVSSACMMTKKALFDEVGGFDEMLPIYSNEVDYCLKLRNKDYYIVYNPYGLYRYNPAYGYLGHKHDYFKSIEKKEIQLFNERWQEELEKGDPFYNSNFSTKDTPYILD